MATNNSFADLMLDWQKLLAACADNAQALTTAEPQRALVEKMLKDAQDLKAQQGAHTASKQSTVQQLDDLLRDGREAVRRLRAMVKATLGTDKEILVQFGIAPNRKRGKKKKTAVKPPAETPPPAAGPPGGPTTGPTAGPPAKHDETGAPRNPTAP
jgi:hypothetical protein